MGQKVGVRLQSLPGSWALVTGASAGIGREYCAQLASLGMHLVLVARRKELLEELSRELSERHSIQTLVLAIDLSRPDSVGKIVEALAERGIRVRLLVNNVGVNQWGPFEKAEPEQYFRLLQLNVGTPVALCKALLPQLTSQAPAAVIQVASEAAYQPVPYMAVYAASKAFLVSFGQALFEEWRKHGVHVQTLIPGTEAPAQSRASGSPPREIDRTVNPKKIVAFSLGALERGDVVALHSKTVFKQKLFVFLFSPRFVVRKVAEMFRPV